MGEDEGPDADEDIDEDLDRRRRAENPARRVVDARRGIFRGDQRFGDAAGGDRRAVGLHRKTKPACRDERLMRQECIGEERQNQKLDHREDDDERGDEHGDLRPGADSAAGGDRRGDAADRNARGERHGGFAREAEIFARDVIDDRPIDQIGLDDRRERAQEDGRGQIELARDGDGDDAAEDDDGCLDVEFRPDRLAEPIGKSREEIADDEAGDEGEDQPALGRQAQRPADARLGDIRRRRRREMRIAADDPGDIGQPEDAPRRSARSGRHWRVSSAAAPLRTARKAT